MAENHTPEVLLKIGDSFAPGQQEYNVIFVHLYLCSEGGLLLLENGFPSAFVKHDKKTPSKEIAFCCLPVLTTP
jgi:hypothetical protein